MSCSAWTPVRRRLGDSPRCAHTLWFKRCIMSSSQDIPATFSIFFLVCFSFFLVNLYICPFQYLSSPLSPCPSVSLLMPPSVMNLVGRAEKHRKWSHRSPVDTSGLKLTGDGGREKHGKTQRTEAGSKKKEYILFYFLFFFRNTLWTAGIIHIPTMGAQWEAALHA